MKIIVSCSHTAVAFGVIQHSTLPLWGDPVFRVYNHSTQTELNLLDTADGFLSFWYSCTLYRLSHSEHYISICFI